MAISAVIGYALLAATLGWAAGHLGVAYRNYDETSCHQ
jgi:hypothetical protein